MLLLLADDKAVDDDDDEFNGPPLFTVLMLVAMGVVVFDVIWFLLSDGGEWEARFGRVIRLLRLDSEDIFFCSCCLFSDTNNFVSVQKGDRVYSSSGSMVFEKGI